MVRPGRQRFDVAAPLPTHWRRATCREVDCPRYALGFRTILDESLEAHRAAAEWIRYKSGAYFKEATDPEGLSVFEFPAGQECFEGQAGRHRIKLDKPEVLTHVTTQGTRRFQSGREFNECMNDEMYAVERLLERR